jgi:hypothetical protein
VGAVEEQVDVPVLVEVEPMDGPYRPVMLDIDILAGGVEFPVLEILERILNPGLGGRVTGQDEKAENQ